MTGYTGILKELVDEIPTRGSERLRRKLSVDVHCLIPRLFGRYYPEMAKKMTAMANELAVRHGISLWDASNRQRTDGGEEDEDDEPCHLGFVPFFSVICIVGGCYAIYSAVLWCCGLYARILSM